MKDTHTTNTQTHMGRYRWGEMGEEWQEAIPYLRRILRSRPDDFQAQFALGRCYFRLRQYDRAICAYRSAAALAPADGAAHTELAAALEEMGDRMGASRAREAFAWNGK